MFYDVYFRFYCITKLITNSVIIDKYIHIIICTTVNAAIKNIVILSSYLVTCVMTFRSLTYLNCSLGHWHMYLISIDWNTCVKSWWNMYLCVYSDKIFPNTSIWPATFCFWQQWSVKLKLRNWNKNPMTGTRYILF